MSEQKINIPKLGIFLGVVAAVAAGLLSVVDASTRPRIEANEKKKSDEALKQVLPAFEKTEDKKIGDVEFKVARDAAGNVVGFAGVAAQEGFSGKVEVMVGFNPDGSIRKVLVTKQTETPGLGTVITDRKVQKTITDLLQGGEELVGLPPNQYLDQYEGRTASGTAWTVVNDGGDVDAKTGATITSRTVCSAVYAVSQTAVDNLEELSKGAE